MDEALVPVAEEAPAEPPGRDGAEGQGPDPREAFHISGFSGRLQQLDTILLVCVCCFYVLAIAFFLTVKAGRWLSGLCAIFAVALVDYAVQRLRGTTTPVQDRSIRRFLYGIPLAFLGFYAAAITRRHRACSWYIEVEDSELVHEVAKDCAFVAGCISVLSMALAALRLDCNGNPGVSRRVRESRWYTACHLMFRTTELMFRLGAGVLLCELLRVVPHANVVSVPIFVCIPFFGLMCVYALMLRLANEASGKPADTIAPSSSVAAVTLVMNPMHFFARRTYESVARKFNKFLFLIRMLELAAVGGLVYKTADLRAPPDLCTREFTGLQLVHNLGPVALSQVLVSIALHYTIMALHSEIQHSTCQALTRDAAGGGANAGAAQVAFTWPAERSLYVPPPPESAGLGRAWAQVGGGLPLLPFAEERPPAQLDSYRFLDELGGGAFGVVVSVVVEGARRRGAPRACALKLLNTEGAASKTLAKREVRIYTDVWLVMRELAPGFLRVGHPNILRLYFWSQNEAGWQFSKQDGSPLRHGYSGRTRFHMALMMELCEGNLEGYLSQNYVNDLVWLRLTVHLLAQILLGLSFLHELSSGNVTYRDLKTENVLIVPNANAGDPAAPAVHCKLGDFGYGRVADAEAGARPLSTAGTPYFCAREMEERVRTGVFVATLAEEKALDAYSFGTVAYVLAHGPGYIRERDPSRMGDRVDHPRCQLTGAEGCECAGCRLLENLRDRLPQGPEVGHLVDLVRHCTARGALQRPSMAALRAHDLFRDTNFEALLRLNI